METIQWKIEGMSCSNCALTISKYLEKQGLQNVKLSLVSGDLSFDDQGTLDRAQIQKGIRGLGYGVVNEAGMAANQAAGSRKKPMDRHLRYVLICLPFTVLLLLPMVVNWMWLMQPWIQLLLCLPVYLVGMNFFGRSAVNSLRNGIP